MPYKDKNSEAAKASQKRSSRKYYSRNRQNQILKAAKYNREHKEQVNARSVIRRSNKLPPEKVLWWNARNRSVSKGITFDLEIADCLVPELCPVLGIPLVIGIGHAKDNSPSLDRINPSLGYIKGNVRVISHKANTIKSNATIQELEKVLNYVKRETNRLEQDAKRPPNE